MNNGIKEILAYFEEYVKITDMHDSEPMLNWKDLKIVLDYITNLQKENEQLKKCNKESITFLNQDDIRDILIQKDYNIFNLQSRIDKSIEYIKENMKDSQLVFGINDINRLYKKNMNDLLNILKGSDK